MIMSKQLLRLGSLGLIAILLYAAVPHNHAAAQKADALRAAAVVNDEVVSVLDLVMRTRLVILGSGVEDTPEMRRRIARQVLRRLIDERLQLQEAERLSITVTDQQVKDAFAGVAEQNNMTAPEFLRALESKSILPSVMLDQIRAEIAWQTLVQSSLRRSVSITPQDVDAVVERIMSQSDGHQSRVAEIFLSVPNAIQEEEVFDNALRLVEQARGGANFAGLAREYSQSSTANLGGDLGWLENGELQDELDQALRALETGAVSDPVRTLTGFTILMLRETRQTSEESIDRDAIEKNLAAERLDQLAQRRLQELRRGANIDIRV